VSQHLVIPGEVAHRQQVDAGVLLQLPMLGAQTLAHGTQAGLIQLALPVRFKRLLQLAITADAREAEGMCQCHEVVSL